MGWSLGLFGCSAVWSAGPWELWVLLFNPDRYSQFSFLQDHLARGGWAGLDEADKLLLGLMWGSAIVGAACFVFTVSVSAVCVLSKDRFNRAIGLIGLLLCAALGAYAMAHRNEPIHTRYGAVLKHPRLGPDGRGGAECLRTLAMEDR